MTSVVEAVRKDNIRVLKLLLAVPRSIPAKHLQQGLVLACQTGREDCVQAFLEAGVDPDAALLLAAVRGGHGGVVRRLIATGCDVNECSASDVTSLHVAAREGLEGVARVLLDAGADMNARDSSGSTPLILATRNYHRALTTAKGLLDAGCDLDAVDNQGRTALHYAAQKAIGMELLLSAGANPDIQDTEGNTPMIVASTEGFDRVIQCLVSYNANPNLCNIFDKRALHYLAMKNHWEAIEAVGHAHGAMDTPDGEGKTPLWYAVNHNRPEAVKALLRANCDPDAPDGGIRSSRGDTHMPLKTALEKGLYGLAKLIVLAGAELSPLHSWLKEMEARSLQRSEARRSSFWPMLNPQQLNEEGTDDTDQEEAMEWFEDWVHTPHSLRQICRIHIRRNVGHGILGREEELPLPVTMRDYVTLREVEDHSIEGFLM